MNPHKVPGIELDVSSALVGVELVVFIKLLNSGPYLGMEILDLFHPLVGLPTKLSACGDGGEIKGSAWVGAIDHLKRREARGFTWSPIECKLGMAQGLIPTLDIPPHKDPK